MSEEPDDPRTAANRENARKSTGPKDTSATRRNATKHGLLAEGVTELDNPASFMDFRARLEAELRPVGEVEVFLVHRIALYMIRLRRADLLEAEFITEALHPRVTERAPGYGHFNPTVEVASGVPARIPQYKVDALGGTFQRYETAIENKLYRALNQLERMQRLRGGERILAPVSIDIGLKTN